MAETESVPRKRRLIGEVKVWVVPGSMKYRPSNPALEAAISTQGSTFQDLGWKVESAHLDDKPPNSISENHHEYGQLKEAVMICFRSVAFAIGSEWHLRTKDLKLYPEFSFVLLVSRIEPDDSMKVSSNKMTVMGSSGSNQLPLNLGSIKFDVALDLGYVDSGVLWVEAKEQLPSSSKGVIRCSTFPAAVSELTCRGNSSFVHDNPMGGGGSKEDNLAVIISSEEQTLRTSVENNPGFVIKYFNLVVEMLSESKHMVGERLRTAGGKVDPQIGAAIMSIFGVMSPNSGKLSSPIDYFRLGFSTASCLLMICSWMLKPNGRDQRLKELSDLFTGVGVICAAAGIFCNNLAPLPGPYATCLISACVFLVIWAIAHSSSRRE